MNIVKALASLSRTTLKACYVHGIPIDIVSSLLGFVLKLSRPTRFMSYMSLTELEVDFSEHTTSVVMGQTISVLYL